MDRQSVVGVYRLVNDLLFSSDSETDDDDLIIMTAFPKPRNEVPRIQNYAEEIVPTYTDEQFRSHFRLYPATFDVVLSKIQHALVKNKTGYEPIEPRKMLLITLWRMATPDSYRSICEKFNVGRATAWLCVKEVTKALSDLSTTHITWPSTPEKFREIRDGFSAKWKFPNVVGAIDGTHIKIRAPKVDAQSYINKNKDYSIQMQAICDHKCRFIHCFIGYPGSVHDQRVFRNSEVQDRLGNQRWFPADSHLIGDAGYMLHENVMIPYRNNGHLSGRQKNYNFIHSSTRMAIERAFGILKKRFRSLLTMLDMERMDLIPEFILACCVLHNICIDNGDEMNVELDVPDDDGAEIEPGRNRAQALRKRDDICNTLPLTRV